MSNLLEQSGQDAAAGVITDKTVRTVAASDSPDVVALQALGGTIAVTYDAPVPISQGSTPGALQIRAADGTKVIRLHALIGTLHVAGTLRVNIHGGAALTGNMTLATNGGDTIPPVTNPDLCIKTGPGDALGITTDTGAFNGYAITSTATT